MSQTSQASINIPQLIAVALVGFLAIRWYLSKPTVDRNATNNGGAPNFSTSRPIDITKIEQISAMFPQLDRRSIAWDLHRNGWSVSATTERILGGRALDQPPPSFQPEIPPAATAGATASSEKANGTNQQPDLITRYGLQSKIAGKGKEPIRDEEQDRIVWSSDKASRADNLRRRREEMILTARRKMEQGHDSACT